MVCSLGSLSSDRDSLSFVEIGNRCTGNRGKSWREAGPTIVLGDVGTKTRQVYGRETDLGVRSLGRRADGDGVVSGLRRFLHESHESWRGVGIEGGQEGSR